MGDEREGGAKGEGEKKAAEGGRRSPVTVFNMDFHCEGCAKKVIRAVKDFDGVEAVKMDTASNELTIRGRVDPAQIKSRLEEKTKKKVEIISPLPKDSGGGGGSSDKNADEKSDKKPTEEKKSEEKKPPKERTVVLKINLDCAGCICKIQKLIRKIDGVNSVEVDEVMGLITVKGTMEVQGLAPRLKDKFKRNVEVVPPKKEEDKTDKDGNDETKEKEKGKESGGSEVKAEKIEERKEREKHAERGEGSEIGVVVNNHHVVEPYHEYATALVYGNPGNTVAPIYTNIGYIVDNGVDELRKLLSDKDAYRQFLHSFDQVKIENSSTVVLKIKLHCTNCISKIKKIIRKIEGVNSVEVDQTKGLVTVKGTMEVQGLAPYLKDKFRRNVEVVSPKKEEDKKDKDSGNKKKEKEKGKESGGGEAKAEKIEERREGEIKTERGEGSETEVEVSKHHVVEPYDKYATAPMYANTGYVEDNGVDELGKLLSDKDAYHQFLHSLIKIQNNMRDESWEKTLKLAGGNLEEEQRIIDLRNQCRIIRTTELAAAQEKFSELNRQKEDILRSCSPASLVQRLQDAMNKAEEESESLHRQLLDRKMDLGAFVHKYKELRTTYHRRALIHLAAKTSPIA